MFNVCQNKFYIESKLNRDLREDLMKLFADHVAEIHVNTLMRECIPPFEAMMAVMTFENCSSVCNCEQKLSPTLGYIKGRCLSQPIVLLSLILESTGFLIQDMMNCTNNLEIYF